MYAKTDYLYVATVYTKHPGGFDAAFNDAAVAAAVLMRAGYRVHSPIVHGHVMSRVGKVDAHIPPEGQHDFWMAADLPAMHHAAALIVVKMPGWENSSGINYEIKKFIQAGKEIFCVEWPMADGSAPALQPLPHAAISRALSA